MQIDASDCLLGGALSLHRTEVGPLVHHPTVGKPQTPYWPRGPLRISLLPPLFAQNTDAGFASAHALCGLVTSRARKMNPIDRRISFSRFVSVFDTLLHRREASHARTLSR